MKTSDIVKRADELLAMGEAVLATRRRTNDYTETVDGAAMKAFRVASLSFIDRIYGRGHSHFTEFAECSTNSYLENAKHGFAVMQAIRAEIAGGWLFTVRGLVTAEVFADFIEMAEHLHASGYKDPAAVMAGSVLEEHLRQLCASNSIDVFEEKHDKQVAKKADRLNSELASAIVYSKLDQKLVTAWLDLRNNAAHGKYEQYTADQVKHLITGVTEFMARVSA